MFWNCNNRMKSDDKIVRHDKPVHAFHCHATTAHANMLFPGKAETAEAKGPTHLDQTNC